MKIVLLPFLAVLLSTGLESWASENYEMSKIDFIAAPKLTVGFAQYDIGDLDEGRATLGGWGLRAGFKVGSFILGGEYSESGVNGRSRKTVSDADRLGHPSLKDSQNRTWGWSLGYVKDRFIFWYGYYGYNKIRQTVEIPGGETFNFDYVGNAHMLEASFRVWKYLYIGAFGRTQVYNKYTSSQSTNLVANEPLDPRLKMTDYGASFSLNMPISALVDAIRKK